MTLPEAQQEFAARLYLWAKEEIKREVREGFPLLRKLETGGAFLFLNYTKSFSTDDCIDLMTACLKRNMKEAAESFGETYSRRDADLVEGFIRSPIVQNPSHLKLLGRQLEGEKNLFADRKVLRTLIKAELKPILGEKITKYSTATWVYLTPIGSWTVQTNIDTGGKCQLTYFHRIGSPFHPFLYEHPISVLSWLGTFGQAQWSDLTNDDVPGTVQLLSQCCAHFLAVVPKLLAGINPSS
jgi:hypothetical protein